MSGVWYGQGKILEIRMRICENYLRYQLKSKSGVEKI